MVFLKNLVTSLAKRTGNSPLLDTASCFGKTSLTTDDYDLIGRRHPSRRPSSLDQGALGLFWRLFFGTDDSSPSSFNKNEGDDEAGSPHQVCQHPCDSLTPCPMTGKGRQGKACGIPTHP